tara:strand:+ start:5339 stop:5710 length:372 start_codon:yes stop_codon:yes gene_type:complete
MMFAVLAKILGSGDVIKQGMNLIDEMHTSGEEAEAAKSKARVDLLAAYQPFKLAQRYIALMFTAMFLFIMANGVVGALYGVIDMANVEAAKDFASSMWLGEIMLGIVGFYFGGGLASSIKERK